MINLSYGHEERFTVVGNHLAQHPDLSATAIGLGVYIQSLKAGDDVSVKALAGRFREGEITIRRALNELVATGYLERRRVPLGGGRFATRIISYSKPGCGTVTFGPDGEHFLHEARPEPRRGAKRQGKGVPEPEPEPEPAPVPESSPAPVTASVAVSEPVFGPASAPVPGPVLGPVPAPRVRASRGFVGGGAPDSDAPPGPDAPPAPDAPPGPDAPPAPDAPPGPVRASVVALGVLAGLRAVDPRLLLSARDVHRLAPLVDVWLDRALSGAQVTRALTAGLPPASVPVHHPAAFLAYRLRVFLPPPLPEVAGPGESPALLPLITCDGCERAFRSHDPEAVCADCRRAGGGSAGGAARGGADDWSAA
ncbi:MULTISPECIES: hypothetical protein [unclassified Streptomyces]|uniref:hypothetical protein n=1 Tax=unclassified Streptomyces TaxID=2593676 RepID=UPI003805C01C